MKSLDAIINTHRDPTSFRNEQISKDLIATLIQASRVVPTAFHLQPTHYWVVTDDTLKTEISKACFNQALVSQAPAIIIFTGDRFVAREQEANLETLLNNNAITIDEAEKARHALELHFDVSPLGIGWIGKAIGAPLMHLFTAMPQLPAVHKREFLCRQVMRSVMTFFWAAESHDLSVKLVESYDEWRIKWALTIPWHHIVVSVMLVGYSDRENKQVSLQSLDEQSLNDTVHWNKPS